MAEITDSTGETREDRGGAALEEGGVVIREYMFWPVFWHLPRSPRRQHAQGCYTYSIGPWLVPRSELAILSSLSLSSGGRHE